MAARLESEEDSEDQIMQKYSAVVGRRPLLGQDAAEAEGDEEEQVTREHRGRAERPGLVYHKQNKSETSEASDADEMDNPSSQEDARQISSRITGEYSRGALNKGTIAPSALKMVADSREIADKFSHPTPGGLEIRDKLGLGTSVHQSSHKKEVFGANPLRGRRPLIDQEEGEDEQDDDEDGEEEEDDKAKLLAWKRELEEKFKKFESFKEGKQLADSKPQTDVSEAAKPHPDFGSQLEYATKGSAIPLKTVGGKAADQRDSELSRPSNSIRIKDEIMANKGKEAGRRGDSQDLKQSFEKNNFFGRLDDSRPPADSALLAHEKARQSAAREERSQEADALRQRVADLEAELTKCRRESEAAMKQVIENNQKTVQNTRSQYEREIDHLKEQLEEAYIQIKDLEKRPARGPAVSGGAQHRGVQTADDPLEKNFLKLKELYDTLYKANLALVKDQKELQEKYTKLVKAQGRPAKAREEKAAIKIKQESPLRQNKASTSK